MALRGQGTLQQLLGIGFRQSKAGTKRKKAEETNAAATVPQDGQKRSKGAATSAGRVSAGLHPTNSNAQPAAPCHGAPYPHGAGWVCISAAVVGLRFRRNSGTGGRPAADVHQPPRPLPEQQQQQQQVEDNQQQTLLRSVASPRCSCCCHVGLDPEPGNPRDPHAVRVLVSHRQVDATSCGPLTGGAEALAAEGPSKATASIYPAVADQGAAVPDSAGEPPSSGAASGIEARPHEPSACSFCSGGTAVYGQQQHVGYVPAAVALHLSPLLLAGVIDTRVHIDWAGAGAGSSTMPASLPMAIFARPAQQRGQRSTEEVRRSSPKHEAGDKAAHGEQKALHLGTTPSLDCQEEPAPVPGAAGRGAGCLGGEGSPGPGVAAALAAAAAAADAWRAGGGRARGSGGGARPPSATTADGAPPADPGAAGEVLRRNLQLIVDDVRRFDGHLFTAEEHGAMGRLLSLSPPAQCLFLRLLLRRGPWFTQSGLSYSEVADVGAAAEELLGAGMARRPATEDWPQVAELLPVAQVRAITPPAPPPPPRPIPAWARARAPAAGTPAPSPSAAAAPLSPSPAPSAPVNTPLASYRPGAGAGAATPGSSSAPGIATGKTPVVGSHVGQGRGGGQSGVGAAQAGGGSNGAGGNAGAGGGGNGGGGNGGGAAASRAAAIEVLRSRLRDSDGSVISDKVLGLLGPVLRLDAGTVALLGRVQRVYFLNEGTDLGRFLATDRGVIRYPPYALSRTSSAFASRQQLLEYEEALAHAARLEECLAAGDQDGAAAALAPALSAVRRGAHRLLRWQGDVTVPVRLAAQLEGPWEEDWGGESRAGEMELEGNADDGEGGAADGRLEGVRCAGEGGAAAREGPSGASRQEAVDLTLSDDGDGDGDGDQEGGCGSMECEGADACGFDAVMQDIALRGSEHKAASVQQQEQLRRAREEFSGSTGRQEQEHGRQGKTQAARAREVEGEQEVGGELGVRQLIEQQEHQLQGHKGRQQEGGAGLGPCPIAEADSGEGAAATACGEEDTRACDDDDGGRDGADDPWVDDDIVYGDEDLYGMDGTAVDACPPMMASSPTGGAVVVPAVAAAAETAGAAAVPTADREASVVAAMAAPAALSGTCAAASRAPATAAASASATATQPGPSAGDGQQLMAGNAAAEDGDLRGQEQWPGQMEPGQGQEEQQEGRPPVQYLARFCAAWVYASMATVGASLMERQRRYGPAAALLRALLCGRCCPGRRGEWWLRLSVDLQHLGRGEAALRAAEAALDDPWVRHGDRVALQRRVLRLARQQHQGQGQGGSAKAGGGGRGKGGKRARAGTQPPWAAAALWEPPEVVVSAAMLSGKTGYKSRFLAPQLPPPTAVQSGHAEQPSTADPRLNSTTTPSTAPDAAPTAPHAPEQPPEPAPTPATPGAVVGVEELALLHYGSAAGGGWRGLHSEGGVWATLWALLLWDVTFMHVPEVFRSPFQTAPLDLMTDAFAASPLRRPALEARLREVADGEAPRLLRECWARHRGTWATYANWERLPLDDLVEIARCVGGAGLSVVCRLISEDCSGWRGGMPDLLLWRPDRGDAMVSEVKGPRDRLSDQQRAWLAAMSGAGVRVEVLRVVEASSRGPKGMEPAAGNGSDVVAAAGSGGGRGRKASGGGGRKAAKPRGRAAVAVPAAGCPLPEGWQGALGSGGVRAGREGSGGCERGGEARNAAGAARVVTACEVVELLDSSGEDC